ncbi:MAG: pyridoxine 5'-phosphate synthase [Thermodesulfobacteriota bacterium]|nr:pyridoxine 5'-phosphate synthase [Thermodesulfobacteriota bacterium]
MAGLAVNVDHIATLRQARGVTYPEPLAAAIIAELAGADGIVVHLREDRRHIQDADVRKIRNTVKNRFVLEMAAVPEMEVMALEVRPDLVTLVPEKREEVTTEGGLDLTTTAETVIKTVATLQNNAIPVSIFIDADPDQIHRAHDIGASAVEIHTGAFCDAPDTAGKTTEFARIREAVCVAAELGLIINVGHGLCYNTVKWFAGMNEINEFSIGHSIVSRAALVGMDRAVRDMRRLIKELS